MTRNLKSITCSDIKTDVLEEMELNDNDCDITELNLYDIITERPVVRRKVCLSTTNDEKLVFAISYWPKSTYDSVMKNKSEAIGKNMDSQRIEYYREVDSIYFC